MLMLNERTSKFGNVSEGLNWPASRKVLREQMQTRLIVFPNDDGFSVLIWGHWAAGSMRVRRFDNRATMIALLSTLRLITPQEARDLEQFGFVDSCPLYSAEIDEEILSAHGFHHA